MCSNMLHVRTQNESRKEETTQMTTINNERVRFTLPGWRKAKGYTQAEMAEKLGLPTVTYSRWEKNPKKIPISKAFEAASVLGVSVNDIIFLSDDDTKCVTESEA